jgi:uncharacterized protein
MKAALGMILLLSWASCTAAPAPRPRGAAIEAPRPCAPAACERTCEAKGEPAACARIAELYWAGKDGHPFEPAKSFRFAKRACDAGDGFGCALLGLHYQDGLGTAWAPALAVAAYEKACTAGVGVGCFNLAGMYSGAHGVDRDPAKADALMKRAEAHWTAACKGAEPRWCTNLAFLTRRANKPSSLAEGYALDQRACDHGVALGCVVALAVGVELGKTQPDAAMRELVRLCRGGESSACFQAGVMSHDRQGPELMKRGCELGDRDACEQLAEWHDRGELVAKDDAAKRRYLRVACDRASATACLSLARDGIDTGSPDAPALAQRGCQMGHAEACDLAAEMAYGLGDPAAGARWATEGCRMTNLESCKRLIEVDAELPAIPDHLKRALYTSACRANRQHACRRLEKL